MPGLRLQNCALQKGAWLVRPVIEYLGPGRLPEHPRAARLVLQNDVNSQEHKITLQLIGMRENTMIRDSFFRFVIQHTPKFKVIYARTKGSDLLANAVLDKRGVTPVFASSVRMVLVGAQHRMDLTYTQ